MVAIIIDPIILIGQYLILNGSNNYRSYCIDRSIPLGWGVQELIKNLIEFIVYTLMIMGRSKEQESCPYMGTLRCSSVAQW